MTIAVSESGIPSGTTLQAFLGATEAAVSSGMTKEVVHAAAHKDSAKLGEWVQTTTWDGMQGELTQKLSGFLQDDAADIFAGVWSRCAELKSCVEETRKDPNLTSAVVMADHDFTYSLEPEVDVMVDGVTLGRFPFHVELTCAVAGLELQVKDGGIAGIRCGHCDGSAAISLAGTEIWKRTLVHVDLPGELRLTRPVRL